MRLLHKRLDDDPRRALVAVVAATVVCVLYEPVGAVLLVLAAPFAGRDLGSAWPPLDDREARFITVTMSAFAVMGVVGGGAFAVVRGDPWLLAAVSSGAIMVAVALKGLRSGRRPTPSG